jgi:putative alpha-1,2-mannosidase
MSLCKGFTQGGSNADIVLADSYVKNITKGVDWETGYEAAVKDAEGKRFHYQNCLDYLTR